MKSDLQELGLNIKKVRHERGLTQGLLADKCGMNKADISRIELGKVNVRLLTLQKISTALHVEISIFFIH